MIVFYCQIYLLIPSLLPFSYKHKLNQFFPTLYPSHYTIKQGFGKEIVLNFPLLLLLKQGDTQSVSKMKRIVRLPISKT